MYLLMYFLCVQFNDGRSKLGQIWCGDGLDSVEVLQVVGLSLRHWSLGESNLLLLRGLEEAEGVERGEGVEGKGGRRGLLGPLHKLPSELLDVVVGGGRGQLPVSSPGVAGVLRPPFGLLLGPPAVLPPGVVLGLLEAVAGLGFGAVGCEGPWRGLHILKDRVNQKKPKLIVNCMHL